MLAMWYLQADGSLGNEKIIVFSVLAIAVVMVVQGIGLMVVSISAGKAIKGAVESMEELKLKALPLIDSVKDLTATVQDLVGENTPKVRTITDNLVQTSEVVKGSALQFDRTITDLNARTQRHVATVDGMVGSALTTTAELADSISEGIRVPVQKVGVALTQARLTLEGILIKMKSMVQPRSR